MISTECSIILEGNEKTQETNGPQPSPACPAKKSAGPFGEYFTTRVSTATRLPRAMEDKPSLCATRKQEGEYPPKSRSGGSFKWRHALKPIFLRSYHQKHEVKKGIEAQ